MQTCRHARKEGAEGVESSMNTNNNNNVDHDMIDHQPRRTTYLSHTETIHSSSMSSLSSSRSSMPYHLVWWYYSLTNQPSLPLSLSLSHVSYISNPTMLWPHIIAKNNITIANQRKGKPGVSRYGVSVFTKASVWMFVVWILVGEMVNGQIAFIIATIGPFFLVNKYILQYLVFRFFVSYRDYL